MLCKACRVLSIENFTQMAPSGSLGFTLFKCIVDRQVVKTVNFTVVYFVNEYICIMYACRVQW